MKKNLLKSTLLLLIALSLNAKEIYNVDELVLKALENAPDLKITLNNYKASQKHLGTISAEYLPNINLHTSAGKINSSDNLLLGNLSLKQIIYNFGQTSEKLNVAKYDSESYLMVHKQAISDKIKEVKLAYYEILRYIALINVNKENIKLNKFQLYRAQKYFTAGIRTKIDVSDAKVALIESKLDLNKSEYDLKSAYATLDKAVGFLTTQTAYEVYSNTLDLTDLYATLKDYPLGLENAINFAYKNRFELHKFTAKVKSAQANKKLFASGYYPSLYFNADYTKQELQSLTSTTPKNQYSALINLDWNIYEGGATSASVEEKMIQIQSANAALINAKLLIKKEITQAYLKLYKIKDSVELSQALLEASKEKYTQAAKRYEYGLSDYIELQQSRQSYIQSMATLVINYYNYYSAVSLLDNAVGR